MTVDCIVGGKLDKLVIVVRTCASGDTSDTIDDAASKLKIVSIILLDYWLIKIMFALSCKPKITGSSWFGSVSMANRKSSIV
jgi:hypothetical protein